MRRGDVLLVVDADTRSGVRGPVREYEVQRRLLDADVLDRRDVTNHWLASRLAARAGNGAGLTLLAALRLRRYRAVYCDSEYAGILLSLLVLLTPLRTRVCFLAHWPTRKAKSVVLGRLRAHRGTSAIVVHSSSLVDRLCALGVPRDKIHLLPIAVDTRFWSPPAGVAVAPATVSSAGVEMRDYPTLVAAAEADPGVDYLVAAASPYSRHGNSLDGLDLPANLHRVDCDTPGLRTLYAGSAFVVVPVRETEIGAGLTTIAEAMAMGKAVITSRVEGQSDTITDRRAVLRGCPVRGTVGGVVAASGRAGGDPDLTGPTGLYVPPGDPAALLDAIRYLVSHPDECAEMGRRARRVAEAVLDVEHFARSTADLLRDRVGAS